MTQTNRLLNSCLMANVFVLLTSPAFAQTPSLEERLQRLESELGTLRKENDTLRMELGLDGRAGQTIVKPNGREPTISVGGLVQAQADFGAKGDTRFATNNDRFYLRRARLSLQGRFLEEFDFRLEGDFAGTLAEASGSRAQLTDAYITWNRFPAANVRAGQFKTPFGYEQLYLDPRLFTMERTLVNDRLTSSRQMGVQVAGDLMDRQFSYAIGVFNGTGVNASLNDNEKFLKAGRISYVPWQGTLHGQDARFSVGADALMSDDTGFTGQAAEFGFDLVPGGTKDNTFTGRRKAGGLDAQVHVGPFDLWVEYLRERFQAANKIPFSSFDSDGWYAQAAYFFVPRTFQGVLKYDDFDPNVDLAANSTHNWTLGANYYFKGDDVKVQLNYLLTTLPGHVDDRKVLMRVQTIF